MSARPLLLLPLLLLLVACQSIRLERDFDPGRDFGAYRSWSWQEPAVQYSPQDPRLDSSLTAQRIRNAVTDQLEQRGLRQAPPGASGDLKVQVWMIVDQRHTQITSYSGGYWGNPWNAYWGMPAYTQTRTFDYQVGTLLINMFDAHDGKLVWRGSGEKVLHRDGASPAERSQAIRNAVARVLSQYPPH